MHQSMLYLTILLVALSATLSPVAAEPNTIDLAPTVLSIVPINCTDFKINCNGNGICISDTECRCDKGFVTFNCPINVQCCYQQESRVKIFLLSFFVAFTGAPYFVLGLTTLGSVILIFCCCGCFMSFCGFKTEVSYSGGFQQEGQRMEMCLKIMGILGCLLTAAVVVWSLVLWITVAASEGDPKDSNGVSIGPW